MEPQIRFCTSADGTRIAYATLGEGPPLLFVNGFGGSVELDWGSLESRAFFERLAERRFFVWFDRRGVGASQREVDDFSLDAHIADVTAVADHLQLEQFDLLGGDDSAPVGIAYAAQHPERVSRLVLWAPYTCGEEIATPEEARSTVELIRGHWRLAQKAIADILFPSGPIELQRRFSDHLREHVSPEVAARYYEFMTSVDVRPFLPLVKAPTLVLHRRRVRSVPFKAGQAAAARIPDARFVALEGDIGPLPLGDVSFLETMMQFLDEGRGQEPAAEPSEAGAFRTVLFTDVEGSTALTQRLGDAKAREVLREHERMVREALKSHGGSEVKTLGDGFMASFTSATGALECAIAMQRAFAQHNETAEEPILVRVGLNAGEPIAEDDPDGRADLFGTTVNLAARIAGEAEGGEVLASDVVRQLVAGKQFLFVDRGETALRGFEDAVRLYEVRWREEG
jgi:class 3 adenylate cyclase/pimeloyl-ACP methyl ester carboxylesterase